MRCRVLTSCILSLSILLMGCDNFSSIKKNKLMIETLETPSKHNIKNISSEEEAKLKALEALEKYFDVTLYLTEVECYAYLNSPSNLKTNLTKLNTNNIDLMQFENSSSLLENGTYIVSFYSKNKLNANEKYFDYFVELNCKTWDIVNFSHYNYVHPNNNGLDMEDSEKLAKEFVEKNHIGSIKKIKLTDKTDKLVSQDNTYRFTFEDSEDSSKKVIISVNVYSKQIFSFSVGLMTLQNEIVTH